MGLPEPVDPPEDGTPPVSRPAAPSRATGGGLDLVVSGGPAEPERPDRAAAADAASRAWADWVDSPAGRQVLEWERQQVGIAVGDIFGYYAVQLGFLGLDALQSNRMPSRIRVGTRAEPSVDGLPGADLLVEGYDDLPFETGSVDLVVIAHQLESAANPHRVLREIDRILRPEGRLVVIGLNPMSLWGVHRQLVGRGAIGGRANRFMPPSRALIGVPRLRDWLKLLGFEVEPGLYGCHAPACRSDRWTERVRFLDRAGDRWWPILGAVYLLTSVKRVHGMRIIGPSWRRRVGKAPAPAVVASGRSFRRPGEEGICRRESAVVLPLRRRT
ncbi:MAG: class I SAM-dependent methyltransferase [Lautropia sp.]